MGSLISEDNFPKKLKSLNKARRIVFFHMTDKLKRIQTEKHQERRGFITVKDGRVVGLGERAAIFIFTYGIGSSVPVASQEKTSYKQITWKRQHWLRIQICAKVRKRTRTKVLQ